MDGYPPGRLETIQAATWGFDWGLFRIKVIIFHWSGSHTTKPNLPGLERTSSFKGISSGSPMADAVQDIRGPRPATGWYAAITKTGRGRTTTVNQTFSSGRGTIGSCANAVGYSGFVSWANMPIVWRWSRKCDSKRFIKGWSDWKKMAKITNQSTTISL